MTKKKITAAKLAAELVGAGYRENLAPSTVRNWINGSYPVNLEDFLRICKILEISPLSALFGNHYEQEFLELADAWREADEEGRTTIRIATAIVRERNARAASGRGGLPPKH